MPWALNEISEKRQSWRGKFGGIGPVWQSGLFWAAYGYSAPPPQAASRPGEASPPPSEVQTSLTVTALFWKARTSSSSAGPFQCTVIVHNHPVLTACFKNPLQPLRNGEPPKRTFAQEWNINPSSPLLLGITVKTKTPQQESWQLIKTSSFIKDKGRHKIPNLQVF